MNLNLFQIRNPASSASWCKCLVLLFSLGWCFLSKLKPLFHVDPKPRTATDSFDHEQIVCISINSCKTDPLHERACKRNPVGLFFSILCSFRQKRSPLQFLGTWSVLLFFLYEERNRVLVGEFRTVRFSFSAQCIRKQAG